MELYTGPPPFVVDDPTNMATKYASEKVVSRNLLKLYPVFGMVNWISDMRIILLLAFLLSAAVPASGAEDASTAQGIINSQIEAIGSGDAASAYSYAAPAIREIFHHAELFMTMVRQGYAPLYRPKSFEFGKAVTSEGKIVQQVHIIDSDGIAWEALYTLEQQPDGSLKISGCSLLKVGQAA